MPSPDDLQRIRDNYAAMSNEALLHFARHEGHKITADAFLVLRDELRHRNIGADIIHYKEHEIMLQDSLKRKKLSEEHKLNTFSESIEFAFKQKAQGVSNYDIFAGFIEMGIPEEQANEMINKLDEWAIDLRKDATHEIQAGIGLIIVGLIVVYIALQIRFLAFGAVLLAIAGIVRTFTAVRKKEKCDAVLEAIKKEQDALRFPTDIGNNLN